MSEERRGISLRKKKTARPKISAPKQIASNTVATPVPVPTLKAPQRDDASRQNSDTPRAGSQSRSVINGREGTADLVKRRYSTRFAAYPQDGSLPPPVPGLPQFPAQYAASAPGRGGSPERREGHKVRVDARALRDPNLQVEQYVATVLADATESDIHTYQTELQKLKNRTSTDLQHNVYQNRTQFIKISKEADKLKAEMSTLRTLMSDLTGALSQAASASGPETNGMGHIDRKNSRRTSVANLEALWSSHLQALWKRVEGSQKYLPAIPGRHIVHESGRWVELNAATWKPRRRVHIILLNDHLLIASEKKRVDPSVTQSPNARLQSAYQPANLPQLIAERCWPLQDVQMADISRTSQLPSRDERSNIANAINVRVGSESWTFATASSAESSGEKSGLLVAFRKAVEDLRKTMAAEHGERERALDELAFLTGKDSALFKKTAAGNDAKELDRSAVLTDVDGRQHNIRGVESQIDALDIDIALQRFEEAVARSERLRRLARSIQGNAVAQDLVTGKIDERAARLAGNVARRLKETNAGATVTKENVAWLVRLGFEEVARVAYLDARREVVRKRTRQLPFTGALPPHLTALSYVTFGLILNTFRTFTASFPPAAASAVVKWAKERVDEFNDALQRHLGTVERGSPLWDECVAIVMRHSEVLAQVGVDFKGLIAQGLSGDGAGVRTKALEGRDVRMVR